MKFSVLIPVYKAEKYLKECLDSVLHQTFTDFEVILVDDGSPDNCPQICDEYAKKDNRVKVIHQKNAGQAAARNAGLNLAKGEYVCFIDSDDYLARKDVFMKLSKNTENSPDIIHYKFKEWLESSNKKVECKFNYDLETKSESITDIYCELIDKDAYFNSAWSKIIKRNLLIDNNILFEEGLTGEDNEWYYHVVLSASTLKLIDEPFYVYRRRNNGSVTTTLKEKNLADQLYILEKWTKILSEKKSDPKISIIRGSLAKQYCSAVIIYSGLDNVKSHYKRLKSLSFLLNYTKTPRVKQFRFIKRYMGLKGLIKTLKIIRRLR